MLNRTNGLNGGMNQAACERWLNQLIDSRNGLEVILFGLSTVHVGWHIQPRRLDEHLVYFVLQHRAEGTVAGKPVHLAPNDFLWLRPGVPHRFSLSADKEPFRLYHLRFVQGGARGKRLVPAPLPVVHLHHAEKMRVVFDQMFDEHRAHLAFSGWRFRVLLAVLLSDALRAGSVRTVQRKPKLTPAQRAKIEALCQARKDLRVTPAELAASLHMSLDYFTRLFKSTFGLPPRLWVARERIRRAAEMLLETSLNISQIADELGYGDLFSFSRQFKEIMALSPRDFRQSHL